MNKILSLQKWQIVSWSTSAIAIIFCSILLTNGLNEASWRIAIRFTARSSCLLFLLAFIASSIRRFKKIPVANWLVNNRRYLGLSMAISHGFHAVAITGVAIVTSENMVAGNHGANLGYVFILLMTLTSFDSPAAMIGRRGWRILHTVGMYYLWLSFTVAFSEKLTSSWLLYTPFMVLLVGSLLLRIMPTRKKLPQF